MSDLRKAAQQMVAAMESYPHAMIESPEGCWNYTRDLALDALRAALTQPEQEPVAWWDGKESVVFTHDEIYTPNWTDYWTQPLYTAPPQRKPLTEEQIAQIDWKDGETLHDFARAIEKAHGIRSEHE